MNTIVRLNSHQRKVSARITPNLINYNTTHITHTLLCKTNQLRYCTNTETSPKETVTSNLFEAFSKGITKYRNAKLKIPTQSSPPITPEVDDPEKLQNQSNTNFTSQKLKQIAFKTIQSMPDVPYNHMVAVKMSSIRQRETDLISKLNTARRKPNEYNVAYQVFSEIKKSEYSSPIVLSLLIESFSTLGKWDIVTSVISLLFNRNLPLTINIYNSLIAGYLRNNCAEAAYRLLQEIAELNLTEDITTCNLFLEYHSRTGEIDKIRDILNIMLEKNISPTIHTYVYIISAYSRTSQPQCLKNVFQLIREYVTPNIILFNQMIQCCAKIKDENEVELILEDMKKWKKQIDSLTYLHLIELYTAIDNLEKAEQIYSDLKLYYTPEPVVFNWMIEMYARKALWDKVEQTIEEARKILKREEISIYNTFLGVSIMLGNSDLVTTALQFFQSRVKCDQITYSIFENSDIPIPKLPTKRLEKVKPKTESPTTQEVVSEQFPNSLNSVEIKLFDKLLNNLQSKYSDENQTGNELNDHDNTSHSEKKFTGYKNGQSSHNIYNTYDKSSTRTSYNRYNDNSSRYNSRYNNSNNSNNYSNNNYNNNNYSNNYSSNNNNNNNYSNNYSNNNNNNNNNNINNNNNNYNNNYSNNYNNNKNNNYNNNYGNNYSNNYSNTNNANNYHNKNNYNNNKNYNNYNKYDSHNNNNDNSKYERNNFKYNNDKPLNGSKHKLNGYKKKNDYNEKYIEDNGISSQSLAEKFSHLMNQVPAEHTFKNQVSGQFNHNF